jgi:hypothetical protein
MKIIFVLNPCFRNDFLCLVANKKEICFQRWDDVLRKTLKYVVLALMLTQVKGYNGALRSYLKVEENTILGKRMEVLFFWHLINPVDFTIYKKNFVKKNLK